MSATAQSVPHLGSGSGYGSGSGIGSLCGCGTCHTCDLLSVATSMDAVSSLPKAATINLFLCLHFEFVAAS